jgi:hypothetical protein
MYEGSCPCRWCGMSELGRISLRRRGARGGATTWIGPAAAACCSFCLAGTGEGLSDWSDRSQGRIPADSEERHPSSAQYSGCRRARASNCPFATTAAVEQPSASRFRSSIVSRALPNSSCRSCKSPAEAAMPGGGRRPCLAAAGSGTHSICSFMGWPSRRIPTSAMSPENFWDVRYPAVHTWDHSQYLGWPQPEQQQADAVPGTQHCLHLQCSKAAWAGPARPNPPSTPAQPHSHAHYAAPMCGRRHPARKPFPGLRHHSPRTASLWAITTKEW